MRHSSPTATRFDAVVIGAGPAGLGTALALRRRAPVSVLVVDAGGPGRHRVGETAPPELRVVLDRLGLAERFGAGGHLPSPGTASIWGRDRIGHQDFVLDPLGPAWRLDRPEFDRMLAEAAARSGATLRWRTRFVGRAPHHDARRPHLLRFASPDDGTLVVAAGCVVDATGPGAYFARSAGARRQVDDHLFAWVRFGPAPHGATTLQTLIEAVPDGWWYGARTPGDRAVVMFVTDRSGLRQLRAGGPGAIDAALAVTSLVGSVAPPHTAVTRETVLPVYSSALDRSAGEGWIAVGDAAASYDPIAGQGVHKALADGIAAADDAHALMEGSPPPSARPGSRDEALASYRRHRAHVYRSETRFPEAPFWETRRARTAEALHG